MSMPISLSFHGGAGTVTGSRHLLEANGSSVLIDAGMFQGLKELRLLNWEQPSFDPSSVDHLILTHGHIDHAGYLPRLVKLGYRGEVHCTPATVDLAQILLLDSAKIQEEDARYANKKKFSKHKPALPLYTSEDAQAALARCGRSRTTDRSISTTICERSSSTPGTFSDRRMSRYAPAPPTANAPSSSVATSDDTTCRCTPTLRLHRRRTSW